MLTEQLLHWRQHLAIVHHIPGRIRLRVGAELLQLGSEIEPGMLSQLLTNLTGIDNVRINAAAASIIVQYDPRQLPPETWETILLGPTPEAASALENLIATMTTHLE